MSSALMTPAEVAQYLKVRTKTIYRLMKTKQLPAFKVGHAWRFPRDQIARLCMDIEASGVRGSPK